MDERQIVKNSDRQTVACCGSQVGRGKRGERGASRSREREFNIQL